MKAADNHSHFVNLRKRFQTFEYLDYSFNITDSSFFAKFTFRLNDDIIFRPSYEIPARGLYDFNSLPKAALDNLVFHIGMVELISYWKAACPQKLIVRPHKLTNEQVTFWKKLYFNGLGEFFYLNNINTTEDDFMHIESEGDFTGAFSVSVDGNSVMVPVGGGKDSVVTLELLKEFGDKVIPMAMNPREAVVRSIENADFSMEDTVVVKRTLDKKLLELNDQGFLNGHTPFSALLAFVTSLTAVVSGIKYIALSNESSANESTVPGSNINHQYSKSFEFEHDFNNYFSKYITSDIHYFSFLRPLNELQIGALFSLFKHHYYSFRSCNVGSKTDSWCGHCSKCLFVRTILGPFIKTETLTSIFGKELFDDVSLKPVFHELTGVAAAKPFECVGTPDEVNASLQYIIHSWNGSLPALLKEYPASEHGGHDLKMLLSEFNNRHFVPEKYLTVLKNSLKKIALNPEA